MVFHGWRFLSNTKISALVQTLADQLDKGDKLLFLNRTDVIDSDDDEIIGKWKKTSFAADIINEGQEAATYESGSFEFTTNVIAKFKIGELVTENIIRRLDKLKRDLGSEQDVAILTNWELNLATSLVGGIRQSVNEVICAMQRDSYAYDRYGVKVGSAAAPVTWGMPADLKVTSAVDWSDAVNSTPITDLQTIAVDTAPDIYGEQYNRVTMSNRAFKYMVASNEFNNKFSGELRFAFGTGQINKKDTVQMRQFIANLINMEIEIYDETFWRRANNGAKVRQRVLPHNEVIFSSTADDNNRNAMYFANGIVTESTVGSLHGYEGFTGDSYGPIAYYEDKGLNPPVVEAWSVARGWPVKVRESCTARLTVGSGSNWA